MPATTAKVSISMDAADLAYLQRRARKRKRSLSSLVSEAVKVYRDEEARREAQLAFLATLKVDERATSAEMDALEAAWRG